MVDFKMRINKTKTISARVSCPSCGVKHYWSRREALAYDAGKSIKMECINCLCKFWVQKQGKYVVVTKEVDEWKI